MTDKALDILKNALLLERRGRAFYAKVAEQSSKPAVREFFETMAAEEEEHVRVLGDQMRAYASQGAFAPREGGGSGPGAFASAVLGERLQKELAAADFEAAAVGAAMAMERSAIQLYAGRAESSEDPEERALYRWLAAWEQEHLEFLSRVDRAVVEAAWNDAGFWPF